MSLKVILEQITLRNSKPKFIQIEMNWHNLFSNKSIYEFSKILIHYDFYIVLPYLIQV